MSYGLPSTFTYTSLMAHHPVCTETRDAVQEGVRLRCYVIRNRSFNSVPFEEFPNSRYMDEKYEIRVWATPRDNFIQLVSLSFILNCSKLYEEDAEFEEPQDKIESKFKGWAKRYDLEVKVIFMQPPK